MVREAPDPGIPPPVPSKKKSTLHNELHMTTRAHIPYLTFFQPKIVALVKQTNGHVVCVV